MKRAKNLYPLIPTHDNLREAFRKTAKGRRTDSEVIRFGKDFDANIRKLREQLLQNEPDIGHYRFFTIRKYFDSIDHAIALGLLARRFNDKKMK